MTPLAANQLEADLIAAHTRPLGAPVAEEVVVEPGDGVEGLAQARRVLGGDPLVLPRALAPELARGFEALRSLRLPDRLSALSEERDLDDLVRRLPEPQRSWLRAEIGVLVDALRAHTEVGALRGALYVVDRDNCRKFHVDAGGLRLLVTYAGPGTQLIVDPQRARPLLAGDPEGSLEEFNAAVIRAGGIFQAKAGDVVLMRGQAGPGAPGLGVLHRSPPVARLGLRRLLLVLDAPFLTPAGALVSPVQRALVSGS